MPIEVGEEGCDGCQGGQAGSREQDGQRRASVEMTYELGCVKNFGRVFRGFLTQQRVLLRGSR